MEVQSMQQKLKYISTYALPTEKALGVQIAHTCGGLAHAGMDVELIAPARKHNSNLFAYYSVAPVFRFTQLSVRGLGGGMIGYWSKLLLFLWRVRAHVKKTPESVLYGREPAIGLFFPHFFLELHTLPARVTPFHRFLWRRAAGIIALTEAIRQQLIAEGISADRVCVARDAVPERFLQNQKGKREARAAHHLPKERRIVGYIGKYKTPFGKGKGVDELITSFPKVQKAVPDAFLLLVGINPDSVAHVREVCRRAGVSENEYEIHTHVPHECVIDFMRAADVLVMNYPWSEHHAYQISPMKLFEYMAAERPIIASDLPAIKEILSSDNAMLIKPNASADLEAAIIRTLTDYEEARRVAQSARADVAAYTWQKRGERIRDFVTAIDSNRGQ